MVLTVLGDSLISTGSDGSMPRERARRARDRDLSNFALPYAVTGGLTADNACTNARYLEQDLGTAGRLAIHLPWRGDFGTVDPN